MSQKTLVNRKPFIDTDWLANLMRIEKNSEDHEKFMGYCRDALDVACPKATYRVSYIEEKQEDRVLIDDTEFHCGLMTRNFKGIHRVFPFAATCGREVYQWSKGVTDVYEQYWAENIMEAILRDMINQVYTDIRKYHGVDKISSMNPGSLEGWPIEEQASLFSLIGDVRENTGIELTESYLMIPQKSVSGILFPSDREYSNCKLCQRKNCPSRRNAFNGKLYEELVNNREVL
ncbi:MAG: vitamin B12 dependent-methionine synthase activation domain-containing protein [Clostridia bacterium]